MNQSTCFGSPAVNSACPNRDPKFPFRHSKTARVNLRPWPQWAAEELCTPSGALRPTKLGRDAFHPRPTSFRRDQLSRTRKVLRAHEPLSLQLPIAHFSQSPVFWIVLRALRVLCGEPLFSNPQSAIRNPQSAIRNHFTPVYRRLSGIIGFHFSTQTNSKN
jgi:hypothetical protein